VVVTFSIAIGYPSFLGLLLYLGAKIQKSFRFRFHSRYLFVILHQ
jgi:hypothetical protein